MPYQAFEIKETSKRNFSSYLFEYECAIILKVWRSKWLLDVCGNKKMSPQALIQVLQLNWMIKVMSQVTAFREKRGGTSEKATGTIQRNVELPNTRSVTIILAGQHLEEAFVCLKHCEQKFLLGKFMSVSSIQILFFQRALYINPLNGRNELLFTGNFTGNTNKHSKQVCWARISDDDDA